ncbi:hypothetical protein Cgig2_003339 [Carnegiea gigantea]|uniref:Uncharacterized protein n=1 Tax=Carnegiea gigantea TaxID=171969 RepID=A0A9Q1K165_9CARY|nr:hypothetical protein Cgig2_003339 [Carnegiea gigantea]
MPSHNSWEEIEFTATATATISNIMETTICLSSSLLSNPLFSTLITLSLLILLYFPYSLLGIFLSPLLISTSILLFLLRFGTSRQLKPNNGSPHRIETRLSTESDPVAQSGPVLLDHHHGSNQQKTEAKAEASIEPEPKSFGNGVDPHCCHGVRIRPEFEPERKFIPETVDNVLSNTPNQDGWAEPSQTMGPNPFCESTFVGWEVGAPLEVIYEAYEGEEEGEEYENVAFQHTCNCTDKIKRYPSLSRCYPESDSDSDSECSSSSWEGELWDGDQDREELIEIALDYYGDPKEIKKNIIDQDQVQVDDDDDDDDDDNLIEIDISPPRWAEMVYTRRKKIFKNS